MKEKELKIKPCIYFMEDFFGYLADTEEGVVPKYTDIKKLLSERDYTVTDTDSTYRTINHWDTEGLLLQATERGSGWRKFNIAEICWLKIVAELREVGMGIEEIKKLKYSIFNEWSTEGEPEDFSFLNVCLISVVKGIDMLVVVDKNGNGTITPESNYLEQQLENPCPITVITLNLNMIYGTVMQNDEIGRKNQYRTHLHEKEILTRRELLRDSNLTEITYKVKDHKLTRAYLKSQKIEPENSVDELRNQLLKQGDKNITFKTKDDKTVVVEVIKKL
jgi:DNA-binding transcriptional MerR regulator